MVVTRQEILDLRKEVQKDLADFTYGRGSKHIYVIQGEERIMLHYVVDLLTEISIRFKPDLKYSKSDLLEVLRNEDWIRYSFSSKSLHTEKTIRARLNIKSTKKIMVSDMLIMQADYLEQAAGYIISRLE